MANENVETRKDGPGKTPDTPITPKPEQGEKNEQKAAPDKPVGSAARR